VAWGGDSKLLFCRVSSVINEPKPPFTFLTPGSPSASFSLPITGLYRRCPAFIGDVHSYQKPGQPWMSMSGSPAPWRT
jgi:hypothetical protein